ncbi:MAG: hypothetical protein E7286_03890 [Lachnospiraceae bacterium]|nr:hypothetical protein [Lachnospiraceae bacterium]
MAKKRKQINPYPLGAHPEGKKIKFSFVSSKSSCGVCLYDKDSGELIKKVPFSDKEKIGNIFCKQVSVPDVTKVSYQFYEDDTMCPDRRARAFAGKRVFGEPVCEEELKAVFEGDGVAGADFPWEGDESPKIPYKNCIAYCLHVRGFTMDPSSGVTHRGTFLGLAEKLPYLKKSGITTVELQPAYEFTELPAKKEQKGMDAPKLNYWGYQEGYYYAPKSGYAAGEDAVWEFKSMVKAFHQNGLELVMQFYFPKGFSGEEILEILRFWVLEYHVDGFHLIGEEIPAQAVAKDPLLAETKLWCQGFDVDRIYGKNGREKNTPEYCNLAEYNDDYMYTMRRFLKGDEDMLQHALYHQRRIPRHLGRIHYLTNYNTMTMMDMVSYDYKHNEANGEDNRDGNSYNYSWNCGEEGISDKQKVLEMRARQLKNAMSLLLLSNSTPLIFMGDEFGNSQGGNNNPYCQDNEITWLDWNDLEKHRHIYNFWQEMVALRNVHPILHPAKELRLMDYLACGYPDLSYHGSEAWRPETNPWIRHVGLMFGGQYAGKENGQADDFFYLAINMHWEEHGFARPKLPEGYFWEPCIASCPMSEISGLVLPPRSIVLYKGVRSEEISKRFAEYANTVFQGE